MKILHTSDWHLGHTLYNYDRTEEQSSMLKQLEEIVHDEQPDVFLLAGDVYHTSQPSASVQTLFTEALVRIHQAHPSMTIVVTAGNHDSGTKHEIFKTPWKALNVYSIGNIEKENPERHIIYIPDKGYIIAVPYTYERNIPEGFFQQLLDKVAEQNSNNLPVIMTAHTTVGGCDFTGHETTSDFTVGGIDSYNLSDLGQGYDYLALGHIHHAQFIYGSNNRARYCGSPIPVSFDETYDHSISMVELEKHGDSPIVRTISIQNPHPLVTIPTDGAAEWNEVIRQLKDFPDDIPAYIRLNVEVTDFLPPESRFEAMAITEKKAARFCLINTKRKQKEESDKRIFTIAEFQKQRPIDIAQQYIEDLGMTFDEELKRMFQEVERTVNENEREINQD